MDMRVNVTVKITTKIILAYLWGLCIRCKFNALSQLFWA